jgi:hypothetical protein
LVEEFFFDDQYVGSFRLGEAIRRSLPTFSTDLVNRSSEVMKLVFCSSLSSNMAQF